MHALLGENGAGKTTLMKILSGYYRPDLGSILMNGRRVDLSSPAEAMKAGIGIVHQHFHLIETMTAAENIHLGWSETPQLVSDQVLNERMQAINRPVRDAGRPPGKDLAALGRRAAAGRDPARAGPRRPGADPRRADRRAHSPGSRGAFHGDALLWRKRARS